MEVRIKWNEGEGHIVAGFSGSGDGPLTFSSSENEGLDRQQDVTVETTAKTGNVRVLVQVMQEGKREVFQTTDGAFCVAGGGSFNVLK